MELVKKNSHELSVFLSCIALLIVIGLIFIYSSSSVFALDKFGSPHYFVKKQLVGILLGLCGLVFFRLIPLDILKRLTPFLFFGSLMLTMLTSVSWLSSTIHGSRRWIHMGSLSFQPSELLKISVILYMAYFLSKKHYRLRSFVFGYLPFMCILGLASLVLLQQPDFGQTVALCAMAFMLFFIAQLKTIHVIATFAPLVPVGMILIYLKPYRFQRILTFLNPWQDPQGAGFQIIQSLIAIGSGNVWGIGIAQSKQKFFYLPMQHTDFIFSIIAEETGLVGSCLLMCIYIFFLYTGLRIAWHLKDPFGIFTTLGFVILTSLQTLINLCVTTGLLPTKGIGLPFVSYGNSALVAQLCIIGVIINCVQTEKLSTTMLFAHDKH